MSFDYARARATAERLIRQFGAPAILRKPGWISGPPSAREYSEQTSFTVRAVDLGIKTTWRDGSATQETTRSLYVSTEGLTLVTPEPGDRIAIIGEGDEGMVTDEGLFLARSHEIAAAMPLSPAGGVILWELRLQI